MWQRRAVPGLASNRRPAYQLQVCHQRAGVEQPLLHVRQLRARICLRLASEGSDARFSAPLRWPAFTSKGRSVSASWRISRTIPETVFLSAFARFSNASRSARSARIVTVVLMFSLYCNRLTNSTAAARGGRARRYDRFAIVPRRIEIAADGTTPSPADLILLYCSMLSKYGALDTVTEYLSRLRVPGSPQVGSEYYRGKWL